MGRAIRAEVERSTRRSRPGAFQAPGARATKSDHSCHSPQSARVAVGVADSSATNDSSTNYPTQMVPFGQAKRAAYMAYAVAAAFDHLEHGQVDLAEAQLGLLLAAIKQAALRDLRWTHAWLLCHLPDPPWNRVRHVPDRSMTQPLSRLASPTWMAAVIAYARDSAVLAEAERGNRRNDDEDGPPRKPKGTPSPKT